ncbi:hypothetical protein FA95DRAFT_1552483 [Auriscalpium vulgare]|uniref:Uncharacterized protein n=1 Tax=Auriscalpium vulgare TaxID=40419 RepID=A0ACB8SC05_9AGAM|nr:hypothetical protein FA95DRAFT_1552483 [Auriscalpium vulgare]
MPRAQPAPVICLVFCALKLTDRRLTRRRRTFRNLTSDKQVQEVLVALDTKTAQSPSSHRLLKLAELADIIPRAWASDSLFSLILRAASSRSLSRRSMRLLA